MVGCLHYDIGFEVLQERDNHVRSHNRDFKCPEPSCFYGAVGFASSRSLSQHISQCHTGSASDKFIFPMLKGDPTKDEQQRLREAIEGDDLDLVQDLVQKNRSLLEAVTPSGGRTTLQHAARHGKVQIAQLLLRCGSDIGAVNASGSALNVACLWGQTDMVRFLLSNSKCDVNSKNSLHQTPLHVIASSIRNFRSQVPILRLLLDDSRVFLNSRDHRGKTPLASAASRCLRAWSVDPNAAPLIEMLLGHPGVDANARDNDGRTPLSLAANWSGDSVVEMFLRCGKVDVNAKDYTGRTPLSWAMSEWVAQDRAPVIRILREHGGVDRG